MSDVDFSTNHEKYNELLFKDKGVCSWNIKGVHSVDPATTA